MTAHGQLVPRIEDGLPAYKIFRQNLVFSSINNNLDLESAMNLIFVKMGCFIVLAIS